MKQALYGQDKKKRKQASTRKKILWTPVYCGKKKKKHVLTIIAHFHRREVVEMLRFH